MANILIFGDSIAYGCWDQKGGWAQQVKQEFDNKTISAGFTGDHFVYPLGIPGDTTHTLLQRFKQEADARIVPHEESLFIFSVGINDSIFNNRMNSSIIPLWKSKSNIQALIRASKRYSKKILFVGLTPVDEAKVDPMAWLADCSYKNDLIYEYDKGLKDICLQEDALCVDIYTKWQTLDYKKLLVDGIHPNTHGHELLFQSINHGITKVLEGN